MGALTPRITWEALRSLNAASLTGGYDKLGAVLAHPSYICKMVNISNVDVTVSINGTSDIDVCPANSFWLYDEGKFLNGVAYPAALPQGTQISVKGSAGVGTIYLVTQYLITA